MENRVFNDNSSTAEHKHMIGGGLQGIRWYFSRILCVVVLQVRGPSQPLFAVLPLKQSNNCFGLVVTVWFWFFGFDAFLNDKARIGKAVHLTKDLAKYS